MADDYSQRAAKGQAYNLAISTAIADGKQHDNRYIVKQYLRHIKFASMLQKANPDQLASAMDNPGYLELLQKLDSAFEGK